MLLDYGCAWLREYNRIRGCNLYLWPRWYCNTAGAFLLFLFALQGDPEKPLQFGLFLFALQGFQNIRIGVVVELQCNACYIVLLPSGFAGVIWHRFSPPAVVGFGSLWLYYIMGHPHMSRPIFNYFFRPCFCPRSACLLWVFCGSSVSCTVFRGVGVHRVFWGCSGALRGLVESIESRGEHDQKLPDD